MGKLKAGFIGFVGFQEKDPYPVLESYAKIGYRAFEGGDMLFREGDPLENLKRVNSFGMQPLSLGMMARDGKAPDVAELIKKAQLVGIKRVTSFAGCVGMYRFGASKERPSYDAVMQEIENYEKIATELKKEDIVFAFHNHDVEFLESYRGVPALYLMAANSENLKFEIDCGWAAYAGEDPVLVLNKLGDRVSDVHIKDFVPGKVVNKMPDGRENVMPRFTTPGTGVLNLAGCLEWAMNNAPEWAIIEQDFQYNLTTFETLTAAYLNMKETGFVE